MPRVKSFACLMMLLALAAAGLFAAPGQVDPPPEKKWTLRWDSVGVTATADLITGETRRTIQLSGVLHLNDADVLALNTWPTITALDGPDGKKFTISTQPQRSRNFTGYLVSHTRHTGTGLPLNAQLPTPVAIPDSFKRIAGYCEVLSSTKSRRVDLPLEPGEWVSLGPQMAARILDAELKPNSVKLKLKVRAGSADQAFFHHGFYDSKQDPVNGPFPKISKMSLIQKDGGATSVRMGGSFQEAPEGGLEGDMTISISFSPPGRNYKTLRIELTDELEIQQIPFELHDVRVPSLRP